jgi:homoserine acetyltransferase
MHAWIWGVKYPDAMDALVPMASQPTEMASRNWMMRRLMIETIRSDPDYNNGNYTTQPRSMKLASVFYATATNGGTLAYQKLAPTRAQADKLVDDRLNAPFRADANDIIYAWESARLQSVGGTGAQRSHAARHQRRRRRAQPAGDRTYGERAQTREKRPPAPDPGERRNARPRHHWHGEVLQTAT